MPSILTALICKLTTIYRRHSGHPSEYFSVEKPLLAISSGLTPLFIRLTGMSHAQNMSVWTLIQKLLIEDPGMKSEFCFIQLRLGVGLCPARPTVKDEKLCCVLNIEIIQGASG